MIRHTLRQNYLRVRHVEYEPKNRNKMDLLYDFYVILIKGA